MKRLIMVLLITALTPMMVRAEFFIDALGGLAQVQSGTFYAWRQDGTISSYDGGDLSGSTGFATGLCGGYWLRNPNWIGVALDGFGFDADAEYSSGDVTF